MTAHLPSLRIAVCFSGKMRTLWWCWGAISSRILDRLPGAVDVFVNTVDEPGAEIVCRLSPRKYVVEVQPELDEKSYWDFIGKGARPVPAILQQLRSVARVNELKQAAELEDGLPYDWVIRIRPDLLFRAPIEDLTRCDRTSLYIPKFSNYWGLNDQFAFGSSSVMDIYCERYHHIDECLQEGNPFHPETLLRWWVERNRVPVARTSVVYSIVREDGQYSEPYAGTEADVRE